MSELGIQSSLIQKNTIEYDPFQSPPNFQLAQMHKDAMSVGTDQQTGQQSKRCPCCHHQINKIPLQLCCAQEDLSFIGVGYPLYFRLTKYYSCLILLVFLVSGSAYYFLVTMKCDDKCIKFFGIPIINTNSNPDQQTRKTEWFNFGTAILIMIGVLHFKPKIKKDIDQFKSKFWCPSAYSIILQNLPSGATEQQIISWTAQLAGQTPVKVNLAYDISAYKIAYQNKEDLITARNKLKIQKLHQNKSQEQLKKLDEKISKYEQEIAKQNRIINSFDTKQNKINFTGTAFVTFNTKQKCNQIIQLHGDSFLKGVLNCLFGYLKSPYPKFNKRYILISQAPSPNDVIWQNLQYSFIRNFFFQILALIFMAILILLAFKFQYYMVSYAYALKQEGFQSGHLIILFQAASMSGIIVLLNYLLRVVIQQFAKIQKYYSYTKFNSAFCNNYFVLYTLITCFTVYIVHGNLNEDNKTLLLSDIHLIMLTNAFTQPLFKLINPLMWFKYFQRMRIRRMKHNPYTQKYINSLWEGYQICNADNYQYINRVLYITVWFAYPAPLGVVFSLIALFLNYWIDKIFLLRVYKFPEAINQTIASKLLMGLQILPLIYVCGTLQFCYQVGTSSNLIMFVQRFLSYGIVFLVIIISVIGYVLFLRREFEQIRIEVNYKQIQYLFMYDYDTQNPITRFNCQIQFLKKIIEKDLISGDRATEIMNLIQSSKKGPTEDFQQHRGQIADIKKLLASSRRNLHFSSSVVQLSNINTNPRP